MLKKHEIAGGIAAALHAMRGREEGIAANQSAAAPAGGCLRVIADQQRPCSREIIRIETIYDAAIDGRRVCCGVPKQR